MLMIDAISKLRSMLKQIGNDQEKATAYYATAEYLLCWIKKQTVKVNVNNSSGIDEKLSLVRNAFRDCCGLLPQSEKINDPIGAADGALMVLTGGTLLGAVPELLNKSLDDEFS